MVTFVRFKYVFVNFNNNRLHFIIEIFKIFTYMIGYIFIQIQWYTSTSFGISKFVNTFIIIKIIQTMLILFQPSLSEPNNRKLEFNRIQMCLDKLLIFMWKMTFVFPVFYFHLFQKQTVLQDNIHTWCCRCSDFQCRTAGLDLFQSVECQYGCSFQMGWIFSYLCLEIDTSDLPCFLSKQNNEGIKSK